jgi:hypothetical protein
MKKTYQKPEWTLIVTSCDSLTLLAGSPGAKGMGYDPTKESLSRHAYFWEDEDDDYDME